MKAYLYPDNLFSQIILCGLFVVFVLWMIQLMFNWLRIINVRRIVLRCGEVSKLRQYVFELSFDKSGLAPPPSSYATEEMNGDIKADNTEVDNAEPRPSLPQPEKVFDDYCAQKGIARNNTIARHLKAIFYAGVYDGELETDSLIQETLHQIFRSNNLLKSILSIFIIVGLLGTLFGLADSLSDIHGMLSQDRDFGESKAVLDAVKGLFVHLRSAFAPSIWGVFLTVFGVVVFAMFQSTNNGCSGLRTALTDHTLTVWVPNLKPSAAQRLIKKLEKSDDQMQANFEAAHKVAQFAHGIEDRAGKLGGNLDAANKVLGEISDSGQELNRFTDCFKGSVDKISSFKGELTTLYNQMTEDSQEIKDIWSKTQKEEIDIHNRIDTLLTTQNSNLDKSLKAFKSYEEAYISERRNIDSKLSEFIGSQIDIGNELKKRYIESVRELLDKYHAEVTAIKSSFEEGQKTFKEAIAQVSNVIESNQESFKTQVSDIAQKLAGLDSPMNKAVDKITILFEAMDRRTDTLNNELKLKVDGQSKAFEEQSERIFQLGNRYETLANQFLASIEKQTVITESLIKQHDVLTNCLDVFSANMVNISGALQRFARSRNAEVKRAKSVHNRKKSTQSILKRVTNRLLWFNRS